jgi:hypothetical protein
MSSYHAAQGLLAGASSGSKIELEFHWDFAKGIKPSSVGDTFLDSHRSPPFSFTWGKRSPGWPCLAHGFVAEMGSERCDVARDRVAGVMARLARLSVRSGTPGTEPVSRVRHPGNSDRASFMKKIGFGPWPHGERKTYSNFKYFLYKELSNSNSNQT